MPSAMFFQRRQAKKLEALETAFIAAGYEQSEVGTAVNLLKRRPLLRFLVLRQVDLEVKGSFDTPTVDAQGNIDWDSIADFLIKIAPLIMELIKAFM